MPPALLPPTVMATDLPAGSRLHRLHEAGDFLDCYLVPAEVTPRAAAEIAMRFPRWVSALMVLRGIVTAPFGLSNTGPEAEDKLGPFPVEHESDEEIVAGFDDRHLDFRISVLSREGHVYLATWAHPHHWAGRLYLGAILPFHILIARNALRRVARAVA